MSTVQGGVVIAVMLFFIVPIWVWLRQGRKLKIIQSACPIISASYTPYSNNHSIEKRGRVTLGRVTQELAMASRYLSHIRTYSVSGAQAWIPRLAGLLGMKVSLGIWICSDEKKNAMEIARAIVILRKCKNIVRVIVGNEVLFRHEVSLDRLKAYMHEVKLHTRLPVTTGELWHIWLSHHSLADAADEIAIHILPFWEGVDLAGAVSHTMSAVNDVCSAFPGRRVYVGEIGWPSGGHALNTVPSDEYQQAEYIRGVVGKLNDKGLDYNVIEAFDQRWKRLEGTVGQHWGLLRRNGKVKFVLGGKDSVPVKSFHVFLYEFFRSALGKIMLLITSFAILLALVEMIWNQLSHLPPVAQLTLTIAWSVWCVAALSTSLHETIERYLMPRPSTHLAASDDGGGTSRKVSIHIACRNEPPDMVMDTLSRMSELFHERYEVHVIDNNSSQSDSWEPVRAHCQALGGKFNFWQVDQMDGNKAGALNFLLDRTSEDVDVIAVVDSDYQVEQDWLGLSYFFNDPEIAVVQSPQDYRDNVSRFKQCCYYEYKSFFNTGMPIRNNFNAIILHGTMTLIRACVLKKLRWSEHCVCEDAELGLRVLEYGYKMKYIPVSYGRGLMPDSFSDYKRQRFRWVRGAMQILMGHAQALFRVGGGLSYAKRYQYIMGWAHWLCQAGGLLMTTGLVAWSAIALLAPQHALPFPELISGSLIFAFLATLSAQLLFYVRYSPDGTYNAWLSILASQALSYVVARAVYYSLWSKSKTFIVTPKRTSNGSSSGLLTSCAGEALLFGTLMLCGSLILFTTALTFSSALWSAMLIVRSIPYGAALVMGYLSAFGSTLESHADSVIDRDAKARLSTRR